MTNFENQNEISLFHLIIEYLFKSLGLFLDINTNRLLRKEKSCGKFRK